MEQNRNPNSKPLDSTGYHLNALNMVESAELVQNHDQNDANFTNKDFLLIYDRLAAKNSKLHTLLCGTVQVLEKFKKKHLYENVYMRLAVGRVLEDMANSRKIGRNLKGLSRIVVSEIESKVWDILCIEVKIFHQNEIIKKYQDVLNKDAYEIFSEVL